MALSRRSHSASNSAIIVALSIRGVLSLLGLNGWPEIVIRFENHDGIVYLKPEHVEPLVVCAAPMASHLTGRGDSLPLARLTKPP